MGAQNVDLTPTQHWELHQGLWQNVGCDMQLKLIKIKLLHIYVDNKAKLKYTYSTKGFIKWFPMPKEIKMPTKAKIKKKPKITWAWIYGDEMLELWITLWLFQDRMKVKLYLE